MVPEPTDPPWTAEAGIDGPVDRIEFDDLAVLTDVTHPLRGRILRHFKEPSTVAEVADRVEMPVTRLYHHVNKLEAAGLIRVVATRRVGPVTERAYQVAARQYGVAERFFESADRDEVAAALGSLFDFTKLELGREIEDGALDLHRSKDRLTVSLSQLSLSLDQALTLVTELEAVVERFIDASDETNDAETGDANSILMTVLTAAFPTS